MNQKQTNRKKSFKRIMKMVVSYYPVLFPLIVLLIIINAVLGALPSIFQQNVIAVLQQAWEQGWTWEVTKPYIVKLVGTLALVYLIALIIGIVYHVSLYKRYRCNASDDFSEFPTAIDFNRYNHHNYRYHVLLQYSNGIRYLNWCCNFH